MKHMGIAGENILAGQIIGRIAGTGIYVIVSAGTFSYLEAHCVASANVKQGDFVCGVSKVALVAEERQ